MGTDSAYGLRCRAQLLDRYARWQDRAHGQCPFVTPCRKDFFANCPLSSLSQLSPFTMTALSPRIALFALSFHPSPPSPPCARVRAVPSDLWILRATTAPTGRRYSSYSSIDSAADLTSHH